MNDRKVLVGQRRASDASPTWLNRNEKASTQPGNRHSAITRNLYNWTSYKTWAEKVRASGNWEDKGGK